MTNTKCCEDLLFHAENVAQVCGPKARVTQEIHVIFHSMLVKNNLGSLAGFTFEHLTISLGDSHMSFDERMTHAKDVLNKCSEAEVTKITSLLLGNCRRLHKLKMSLTTSNQIPVDLKQ
jgi:hypothetical protein